MPPIFYDFFWYNCHTHDHDTTTASHLHVPSASSNLSKAGVRYKGVIIWNKMLAVNINPDSSEQYVKVMPKNCIIQQLIKKIGFINNCFLIKLLLLLLLWSLPFIVILINSVHVCTLLLFAPAPPALVIFCYKCTCSTVVGPLIFWDFLPFFGHVLLYISCIHLNLIIRSSLNCGPRVVVLTSL